MAKLIATHSLAAKEESYVEDLIALTLTIIVSFCAFLLEFITASNCLGHLKDRELITMIVIVTFFFNHRIRTLRTRLLKPQASQA